MQFISKSDEHLIEPEKAQHAAAGINEYMADWGKSDDWVKGARVEELGAFHVIHYGQECILWLVLRWDSTEDAEIPRLLFREVNGKFTLTSGDGNYFTPKDLYPTPVTAEPAATQEGAKHEDH